MSTLHFVQSIEPLQGGGLGQAAVGLHLAMRGLAPSRLVATRGKGFAESAPDVTFFERAGPEALYFAPELWRVRRELVAAADWVHGHGLYVGTNALLATEARRMHKPLCYHVHGFFDPWILARSRWKKRVVNWLFEAANCRAVRLWRALTRKEADQILALGFNQEIAVLPNGIRLEEIDQEVSAEQMARIPARRCRYRMLFLGRLHPKKGLDLLIQCWARLAPRFPDWELLIVGPDEGGYQATLEAWVAAQGLGDRLTFHPAVTGQGKAAMFRAADLFVLPSYSEGFPVAVVEAAAHRLPCVITTECNFPELSAAGAAWECQPEARGVECALATALSADPAELRQRGELGRRLIEASYTWPAIAEAMRAACDHLA